MSDAVRYEVAEGVATVTVNRPDAMNAANRDVRVGLREAFEQAADDSAVRALLLTGAGRAFCVGQDLKELEPLYAGPEVELGDVVTEFNAAVRALRAVPKPTVAAVNGPAAGAGASFAFACDLRVAADTASFVTAFAKIGLVPDTGQSWTLSRLVGPAKALELLMLSEPVRAEQALALGLVTRVVPRDELETSARSLAVALASGPTLAYAAIRRLVDAAGGATFEQTLAAEWDAQAAAGRTLDHRNAVAAFLAKQPPVFEGR